MSWVQQNGKVVSSSEYSDSVQSTTESSNTQSSTNLKNSQGMGGRDSQKQLYDLKEYRDSL
jgi:hypothetical protein